MGYIIAGDKELIENLKRHSLVDRGQKERYRKAVGLLMKNYNERGALIVKLEYEPLGKLNQQIDELLHKKRMNRDRFETNFEKLNARIEHILSYKLNIERPERSYIKGTRPKEVADDKTLFDKLTERERYRLIKLNSIVGNRVHNLNQFSFSTPWKKCLCNERKYYRIRDKHFVGVNENFCWSNSIQLWTGLKIYFKENDGVEFHY